MIDIFFIGTIVNIIWQIFTVLFVLYRFTSFFNVMLGFIKFCGRIFEGMVYIKNSIYTYITKKNGYSILNNDEINEANFPQQQITFKSKIKNIFNKCYLFFNPKSNNSTLPLYETRESNIDPFIMSNDNNNLHQLYDSNYSTYNNNNSIALNPLFSNSNDFYTNLKNMSESDTSL